MLQNVNLPYLVLYLLPVLLLHVCMLQYQCGNDIFCSPNMGLYYFSPDFLFFWSCSVCLFDILHPLHLPVFRIVLHILHKLSLSLIFIFLPILSGFPMLYAETYSDWRSIECQHLRTHTLTQRPLSAEQVNFIHPYSPYIHSIILHIDYCGDTLTTAGGHSHWWCDSMDILTQLSSFCAVYMDATMLMHFLIFVYKSAPIEFWLLQAHKKEEHREREKGK